MKTAVKAQIKKAATSLAVEKGKKTFPHAIKYVDIQAHRRKLNAYYAKVLASKPAPGTAVEMVRAVRKGK